MITGWPGLRLNFPSNTPTFISGESGGQIDLTNLLGTFPFHDTLNYTIVTSSGNATNNTYIAWTMTERLEAHPSQGVYMKFMKSYFMPRQTWKPNVKDYITDENGNKWTILAVSSMYAAGGNVYKNVPWLLECVNLRLEPTLETKITITNPHDTIDGYLSPLTSTGTQEFNVPAAIIQTGIDKITFQGKQILRRLYNVYTYDENDYQLGATITDAAGNTYIISGTTYKTRLDELQSIQVYQNN